MKERRKQMYQGSCQHQENYRKAASLGILAQQKLAEQRKASYLKNPKLCLSCKAPIPYEKNQTRKFCKQSCSASFNNKNRGARDVETRAKISSSVSRSLKDRAKKFPERVPKKIQKSCPFCLAEFLVKKSHKTQRYCSVKCKIEFRKTDEEALKRDVETGRRNIERMMEDGRWKGWSGQGEGVRSYPETFIEKKLIEAEIPYVFQKQIGRFKIDFAVEEKKIALEVDGKQHLRQKQKESDGRKDECLVSQGWLVFRLPWKSIKTESGRAFVENRFNEFLEELAKR